MRPLQGRPKTAASLHRDLGALGIERGSTLMVHSSLRSIGWVVGGQQTVVRSLLDAVGDHGTLVMPAATPLCGDPASWSAPKLPDDWIDEVREHLPLFDPQTTPTTLGAIPEAFRTWPGTLRSLHPLESVSANGTNAELITREHSLAFSEGADGPVGRLHDLDARILLLGVGFNRCTALHFAESLAPKRRVTKVRFPAEIDGRRVWTEVPNVADDNDTHFPMIGQKFLAAGRARQGRIGDAESVLFAMRDLVETAVEYFDRVF
ncbi:MAG: AAC(3) family N-acetyltransferase [Thermoanaerobaculia bacterium]|nr:AAC(3) family N-acetyltransferase [Thermoanaerobaculia bacterium]